MCLATLLCAVALGAVTAAAAPTPTASGAGSQAERLPDSEACDGRGRSGLLVRQNVVALSNPVGIAVMTGVGWCRPLVLRPGPLWKLSALEMGGVSSLTPGTARLGGYISLAPLSFLVFRAAVSGLVYWPFPAFAIAGYWEAEGYQQQWPSTGVTNDVTTHQEPGGGINLQVSAVLRVGVTLGRLRYGPVRLIALNALGMEYWYLPGHDFYYNLRADAVLARSDAALTNIAVLMVDIPLGPKVRLRLGAVDSLIYLPRAGRLAWHQVGGLVMLPLTLESRRMAAIAPYLRLTGYTYHAVRQLSFRGSLLMGVRMVIRAGNL